MRGFQQKQVVQASLVLVAVGLLVVAKEAGVRFDCFFFRLFPIVIMQ